MSETPNLRLPYIAPAQAQKHIPHNEAIRALDALLHLAVIDRTLTEAPADPGEGDRHIVAESATGAFAGMDGRIAAFQDDAWAFYAPQPGWRAWVADEEALFVFDGDDWIETGGGSASINPAPLVGVNATADATNRLSVKSPASLFDHDGAGHQLKINKSASGSTASVLFQDAFSGRAEFGLSGDDDFHVKVSADGATWREALIIDKDDGVIHSAPALLIGTSQNLSVPGMNKLQVSGNDYTIALLSSHSASGSPVMVGYRSRGTLASPATVANGDLLFSFFCRGHDGADYKNSAGMQFAIDGTVGTNSLPTRLTLHTSSPGSVDFAERMRIDSNGNVGVGVTAPTARLQVDGAARVKGYTVAGVPSASGQGAGAIIYVSNEAGGAVLAFSDGTNWRRVTDRAVVS